MKNGRRKGKGTLLSLLAVVVIAGCGGGSTSGGGAGSGASETGGSSSVSSAGSAAVSSESSAGVSSTGGTVSSLSSSSQGGGSSAGSSSSSPGGGWNIGQLQVYEDLDKIDWPAGLTPESVHANDFLLVRSHDAVTVGSFSFSKMNFNGPLYGRYLEVGLSDDEFPNEFKSLIEFEKDDIVTALKQKFPGKTLDEILEKVTTVSLAVWVESGDLDAVALIASPLFTERSVTWEGRPEETAVLGTRRYRGVRGWLNIEVPPGYFRAFMNGGQNRTAPGNTALVDFEYPFGTIHTLPDTILKFPSYLAFTLSMVSHDQGRHRLTLSSDETRRAPALVIAYESETAAQESVPEALGTEEDGERVALSVSVRPSSPKLGDRVEVEVTATDDTGVDYVAVTEQDRVVAYKAAPDDHTRTLSLVYRGRADGPMFSRKVTADDKGGLAAAEVRYLNLAVRGDGKAPELEVNAEYGIGEVYPETYRFIHNDGQKVTLHVHAEDADGLRRLRVVIGGQTRVFELDGEKSVDRSVEWYNDAGVSVKTFTYHVEVTDREGKVSYRDAGEAERLPIRDWDDLALYRNALLFRNTHISGTLPYNPYMKYVYGKGESYDCLRSWCWKAPKAWVFYKAAVEDIGKQGLCYGMSATSGALTSADLLKPWQLKDGAQSRDLEFSDEWTKKYVLTMHASQISDIGFVKAAEYWLYHNDDRRWVLGQIREGLAGDAKNGRYGILSISKGRFGTTAHAVVPWMIRKISDSEWRVYLYDSNKPDGPEIVQREHRVPDFSNPDYFPYLTIDRRHNRWWYQMAYNAADAAGDGDLWSNGDFFYIPYGGVRGDAGQYNTLSEARSLRVNDHDLPGLDDLASALFSFMGVVTSEEGVDLSVVDSHGRVAGRIGTQMKADAPGVVPVGLADTDNRKHEIFLLKKGERYTIDVRGLRNTEYNLSIVSGQVTTTISGKRIEADRKDTLSLLPDPAARDGIRLKFAAGVDDSRFRIEKVLRYAEVSNGTAEPRERVFELNDLDASAGSVLELKMNAAGDGVVVGSEKGETDFRLKILQSSPDGKILETLVDRPVTLQLNQQSTLVIHQ